MTEVDYKRILESLWDQYANDMNELEQNFLDDLVNNWEGVYTEPQKKKIIALNRKYRCKR